MHDGGLGYITPTGYGGYVVEVGENPQQHDRLVFTDGDRFPSIDKVVYIKGLGSWEREQLQELIDKNGLDNFILTYRLDENSNELVEEWLGSDPEKRKKHLSNYTFDINAA